MVDQQDRHAGIDDLAQLPAQPPALVRVQAGRWLIQAQHPGLGHEGARDADELALALGEVGGFRVGQLLQAEQRQRLADRLRWRP